MNYLVIEVQVTGGTAATLGPYAFQDLNEAYAKMYTVLAAASVSTVPEHSCFILDQRGNKVDGQTFVHPQEVTKHADD